MAVTLAQAKLNVTDDVDIQIIDEFQKSNDVLNRITFDDCISPAGGGSTLTYGYTRQITQHRHRAVGALSIVRDQAAKSDGLAVVGRQGDKAIGLHRGQQVAAVCAEGGAAGEGPSLEQGRIHIQVHVERAGGAGQPL